MMTDLKSLIFVKTFIFFWYHTNLLMLRKTWAALLMCDSTSASTELSLLRMLPRYLNCETCSMFLSSLICSVGVMISFVVLFGEIDMNFVFLRFILSPNLVQVLFSEVTRHSRSSMLLDVNTMSSAEHCKAILLE